MERGRQKTYDDFLYKRWKLFVLLCLIPSFVVFGVYIYLKYQSTVIYRGEVSFYISNQQFLQEEDIGEDVMTDINIHYHELQTLASYSTSDEYFNYLSEELNLYERLGLPDGISRSKLRQEFDASFSWRTPIGNYILFTMETSEREGVIDFLRKIAFSVNDQGMESLNRTKDKRIDITLDRLEQNLSIQDSLFKEVTEVEAKIDPKGLLNELDEKGLNNLKALVLVKKDGLEDGLSSYLGQSLNEIGYNLKYEHVNDLKKWLILKNRLDFIYRLIDSYRKLHLRLLVSKDYQKTSQPFFKDSKVVQVNQYPFPIIVANSVGAAVLSVIVNLIIFFFSYKIGQYLDMHRRSEELV